MSYRMIVWLAIATFAVWCIGFAGPYHFDDAVTPNDDPASQSISAFVHEAPRTLRPLTKLTYATEASIGLAAHPAIRRGVTVAMLVGAAFALVLLLRTRGAVLLATIFALHPVHAEGVLEVCGRPAVLAMVLVLATLVAVDRERLTLAAILFGAGVLARETAFTALLPIAVLQLARGRKLTQLAPIAVAAVITGAWLAFTPHYRDLAEFSFGHRPVEHSVIAQLAAIPIGLSLYVHTNALTLDHGEVLTTLWAIVGVVMIVAAAAIVVIAIRRKHVMVALGSAVWLAAIIPTQTIIPKLDPLTERPLELALAGILIALSAIRLRWIGIAIAAALAFATITRARIYRSDLTLWSDAAEKTTVNARPHYNYAIVLEGVGRDRDALNELDRAAALDPFDADIDRERSRLGHLLRK